MLLSRRTYRLARKESTSLSGSVALEEVTFLACKLVFLCRTAPRLPSTETSSSSDETAQDDDDDDDEAEDAEDEGDGEREEDADEDEASWCHDFRTTRLLSDRRTGTGVVVAAAGVVAVTLPLLPVVVVAVVDGAVEEGERLVTARVGTRTFFGGS